MSPQSPDSPTLLIVAQSGRLTYEAVLFVASLRHCAPNFGGRVVVAEPLPGPNWPQSPAIASPAAREFLGELGAELRGFHSENFGARYPHGNKVEALSVLDHGESFLFFDSDTLVTGPLDTLKFDTSKPSASMARENTWPEPPLYGPGFEDIWRAVFDRAGVAIEPTLDLTWPGEHWERFMYFNAGWFFGPDARVFHDRMVSLMTSIWSDPPRELACQTLIPWLDQIALPPVIAGLGGGRPGADLEGLDGTLTWHWRALPLLYARATPDQLNLFHDIVRPNRIKKVLKEYEPFRRMIYHNRGDKVRALFDLKNLPRREKAIRSRIKRERLWMR